jgi:hypothetical protein
MASYFFAPLLSFFLCLPPAEGDYLDDYLRIGLKKWAGSIQPPSASRDKLFERIKETEALTDRSKDIKIGASKKRYKKSI